MRLPKDAEPVLGRHIDELVKLSQTPTAYFFHCDLSDSGTTYVSNYATGDVVDESDAQLLVARSCTLQSFSIKQITAGTSTRRVVYTVRLNGKDTDVSITLTGLELLFRQSPKKIKLTSGDLICVGITRPDGSIAAAPQNVCITYELV